ncbi:MAG TPA: hypothetical protein VNX02_11260 [Steroidobacteraceae bacterium]|jgi:uncharacterized membrane protein|nr:hypothetical protein [Steroidobacteraceae bacterium]
MRMVGHSQGLFALAAASLAIFILAYGGSAPEVQLLPAWVAWRLWVYGSTVLVLAASVGLFFSRTAVWSALTIGGVQAIRASIYVPSIVSQPLSVGAWYGFVEALTTVTGAWILYGMLRRQSRPSEMTVDSERAVRAAQVLFGLCCVFYGASHFVYADYTANMVPGWLPSRLGFAYVTGLGHIAAGVGIVVGVLPRLAATLEATMMSLFGLLVWVPSFFTQPRPRWAMSPENQWSELLVTLVLAASAWVVADSLRQRSWGFAAHHRRLVDPDSPR